MKTLLLSSLVVLMLAHTADAQNSWIYSSYFGGAGSDSVKATALDPISGNVYVAGLAGNLGSPFTSDPPTYLNGGYVYLAMFDPQGQLVSSRIFEGAIGFDALHVDSKGQVYLAMNAGWGMPTSATAYQPQVPSSFSNTGLVMKFAPDGSTIFSTYLGTGTFLTTLTSDSNGNVLVCGVGSATSGIPLTSGAYKTTSGAHQPSFCSKLSSDGSQLIASTLFGSDDLVVGPAAAPTAVASDADGNFIVAGRTPSSSFPTLGGLQSVDLRRNLYRMAPNSTSWTTMDDGSLTSVKNIDYDRQNPNRLFAATDAGVMISEDSGQSWHLLSTIGVNFTSVIKVHPLNAKYMVHVDYNGNVSVSRDGGSTWSGVGSMRVTGGQDAIVPDSSAEGTFYFLQGAPTYSAVRFNLVTGVSTTIGNFDRVLSISLTSTAAPILYLSVYGKGLFRSSNGEPPIAVLNGGNVYQAWVAPSDSNILYALQDNWSSEIPPVERSDDGGQTWHQLPNAPLPSTFLWIDPQSPKTVFIANAEGLQRSDDGGETWTMADNTLRNRAANTMMKDPSGQLWVGTSAGFNSYLVRISRDAKTLLYSTLIGGSGGTRVNAMAIDSNGLVALAGSSASTDFPMTPIGPSTGRPSLGFVIRLSADGTKVVTERRVPAPPSVLATDSNGLLHLAGQTSFSDLPTFSASQQPTYGGGGDGFWMVLDSTWSNAIHSSYLGGLASDSVNGMALLPQGKIFLAGTTAGGYFPTTGNAAQGFGGGQNDAFITIGSLAASIPSGPQISVAPSGAGRTATADTAASVTAGYSTVSLNSGTAPYATAVFSLKQNGVTVSEAGVPASKPTNLARLFVDFRHNVAAGSGTIEIDTGIAIANTGMKAATLTFTLKDPSGQTLATGTGTLDAGHHNACFLDQLNGFASGFALPANFATSGGIGSLEVSSTQPVAIMGLRLTVNQRGETLLTSIPVADMSIQTYVANLYFPQFADGGGYTNSIVLLNTSSDVETGTVNFFNDAGTPVAMTLVNGSNSTSFQYSIPAGGVTVLETAGTSPQVQVGSVEVDAYSGGTPVGAGIFRLIQNGIVVTESGVASALYTGTMRIYVDTTGAHDTGIALENFDTRTANLTVTALDLNGVSLGIPSTVFQLPAKGHLSRFAGELVPSWPKGTRGIIEISTDVGVAGLTLRSLTNERGEFLLTTFPVADLHLPGPTPIVFPQIADGGGYSTEVILIGTGLATTAATVNFYDNSGNTLRVAP